MKLKPYRPLKDDLESTATASSYGGSGGETVKSTVIGKPDFKRMTATDKVAYARQRLKRNI